MAGDLGILPWSLTFRELYFMHRGRMRSEWDRVGIIVSPHAEDFDLDEFNPYRTRRRREYGSDAIEREYQARLRSKGNPPNGKG